MSLQEALKENNDLKQENAHLKSELDRMKKLIFGSKKERFTSEEIRPQPYRNLREQLL